MPNSSTENNNASVNSALSTGTLLQPVRWLLGIAALLALVWVVQEQLGWSELLALWHNVPAGVLLLSFALFAISHLVRAIRIRHYVTGEVISLPGVIKLSVWHLFMNGLLPMRLGEAAFPILLRRYSGVRLSQGFTHLIWLRLLDMMVMGTAALLVILMLAELMSAQELLLSTLAGCVLLTVAVMIAPLNWVGQMADRYIPGAPGRLLEQFVAMAPGKPRLRGELLVMTLLAWAAKMLAITALVHALVPLPISAVVAGAFAGEASGVLPIHGFAGAGTYEAAFVAGSAVTGSAVSELLAAAVSAHLFIFFATTSLAVLVAPIPVKKFQAQPNGAEDAAND